MNAAPMILRFCSGSVTPASRSRNSSRRVDEHERQLQPLEPRPDLRRLVLAQHAVVDEDARQPIADRAVHSIAATVESTPPLRPQTTRPSPTCARIRAVASSTNDAIVQSPRAAADVEGEVAQDVGPCSVCATSGWNSSA